MKLGGQYKVLIAFFSLMLMVLTGCQAGNQKLPTIETEVATVAAKENETTDIKPMEIESVTTPLDTLPTINFQVVQEMVYATSNVNIREQYSTNSSIITVLKMGSSIERIGFDTAWSKVLYEGKECYISSKYLTTEVPTAPSVGTAGTGISYGSGGRIVAIDPGHQKKGNSEKEPIGPGASTSKAKVASGATGVSTKLNEYKLTLQVSMKLKEELLKRGYQVVMIRESDDVNLSNAERAEIANNSGAEIFLRIHGNSIDNSSVHGALTMSPSANNPYVSGLYNSSLSLSQSVLNKLCEATGAKNRGVTQTDTMSGINWCKIPVSIVEMGFMSNPDEDKAMADETYQNKLVAGIANGVDEYFTTH